jgi:GT2 family glycosyltransferase
MDLSVATREFTMRDQRVFWISPSLLQREDPGYQIDRIDESQEGYLIRLHAGHDQSMLATSPTGKELLLLKNSLACLVQDLAITSSVSVLHHPTWLSLVSCIPNSYRLFVLPLNFEGLVEMVDQPIPWQDRFFHSADWVLAHRAWGEEIAKRHGGKVRFLEGPMNPDLLDETSAVMAREKEGGGSHPRLARCAVEIEELIGTTVLPRVSVVILTYNNLNLTKACLQSVIERSQYANLEIIVVDNASTDGTIDYLREFQRHHSSVKIIANRYNVGFAAGNNLGLAAATGEYLVLLNNDTVVTEGWVLTLLHHLMDHSDIGLLGAVTNHIGNEAQVKVDYAGLDQMPERSRAYTLTHMGELLFLRTVAFFCVMMPRSTYARCGPISEEYGIGFFEDDDYCRKVEKLGLKIACAEDVFIHHHLSASFNKLREKERRALFDRNRAIYEKKWGPWIPHRYRY